MLDLFIQGLRIDDPDLETPAQTRDRLKSNFPAGSVRRMTQLGLLVGSTLQALAPSKDDTLVYATSFGESRALESYLDSFPGPSPTLFQTSIHPSGIQQGLIARQTPVRELYPLAGGPEITLQALLLAALSDSPRTLFCGGEERATWLTEEGVASQRTFAFTCAFTHSPSTDSIAKLTLTPGAHSGALPLNAWFDCLLQRSNFSGPAAEGWHLRLDWLVP